MTVNPNLNVKDHMAGMRYLSPTSLGLFYQDREQFYRNYICDPKLPRPPQTEPMSVGSAFDAYVKAFLYERLVGKGDPRFTFEALFEAQVEPHNRDEAKRAGKEVFDAYIAQNALADIVLDLQGCVGDPKFEVAVEGMVTGTVNGQSLSVPFLGKPDIFFITKDGGRVIFDWKVNGYYSKWNVSPKPGYIRLSPTRATHPNAILTKDRGITVNSNTSMGLVDKSWAAQLTIYAWVLGEQVGENFIGAIDQIVVNKSGGVIGYNPARNIKVAQHRCSVTPQFQYDLLARADHAWKCIQSGHIFDDLSREANDDKCATIQRIVNMIMSGNMGEKSQLFSLLAG